MRTIVPGDLTSVAGRLVRGEGVSWAYELLEHVAAEHQLSDAWLVVDPVRGAPGLPGTGPQIFGLGGRAVPLETARTLLARPAGVYGGPPTLDVMTSSDLGAACGAAFRMSVAAFRGAIDSASGLQSAYVIGEAAARATACGARYGWSSTLVLLTTSGDAPAADRWLGLSAALREALRAGDEAGVEAPGIALAILGNAGPDAVRPFVARVRAALSAGSWDQIDLHAAASRTPEETVDPTELRRLAAERLSDIGVGTAGFPDWSGTLELELRLLPGVVSVEMATPVVVVSTSSSESLSDEVLRAVRARRPEGSVRMVAVPDGHAGPAPPGTASGGGNGTTEHVNGNGNGLSSSRSHESRVPHVISATAPGADPAASPGAGNTRVLLLGAGFDADRGTSEVSLALGTARGTGRASAGPLAGGAQATLNALEALVIDVPYYLVSAERAHGVPGDPVVVVLAQKRSSDLGATRAVERLGVATGEDDAEAASRATLGALNRHLARAAVAP
ncbi:MAG: hypothetical protein ACRDXC_08430 [Acidimicrobiales bacterium]